MKTNILILLVIGFFCGLVFFKKGTDENGTNFRCSYLLDFPGKINDESLNFTGSSTLVIQDDDSAFMLMEGVIVGVRTHYVDRKIFMSYKKLNKVGLYVFKINSIHKYRQDDAPDEYYHSIFRPKEEIHWEIDTMGNGMYVLRSLSKTHTLCMDR